MLELKDINKIYNEGKPNQKFALCGISLKIEQGELVAIMGKSGAGKTTMLKIIGCLESATTGRYILDGQDVASYGDKKLSQLRNKSLGIVTQNSFLMDELSAIENVTIPLYLSDDSKEERKERALKKLNQVGMGEKCNQRVSTLSGGERQRVAIARALVNNPQIILADEPTGALDTANADAVINIFTEINAQGTTVIIITHDPDIAARCNRVITLSDGKIV